MSIVRDAMYAAVLGERAAARRLRAGEIGAAAAMSGLGALGRSRPRDLAAEARCRVAFGYQGGELCGCGEVGCDPCGAAPVGACVCGADLCDHWPRRTASRSGGQPIKWMAAAGPLGAGMMDIHSHFAGPTQDELDQLKAGSGPLVDKIGWVEEVGFEQQAFSVMPITLSQVTQEPDPDFLTSAADLADVAVAIQEYDSDYFLPFVQVPWYEFGDAGAVGTAESALERGFVGIGELIVHGHNLDSTAYADLLTNDNLVPLFELAARYDVPVLVHWDLLSVDEASLAAGATAAGNRAQLLELLERLKDGVAVEGSHFPHAVKVIIAHCGGGPMSESDFNPRTDFDHSVSGTYAELVWTLLKLYPHVYFDLSGIQTPFVQHLFAVSEEDFIEPTELGRFLATCISAFPTRFIFGLDGNPVDTKERYDFDWASSIPAYSEFLELVGLSAYSSLFFRDNAEVVLYDQPRVISVGAGGGPRVSAEPSLIPLLPGESLPFRDPFVVLPGRVGNYLADWLNSQRAPGGRIPVWTPTPWPR